MYGQDIQLLQEFNGRYDYLAFGNTLNKEENGLTSACEILTESSAELLLEPEQSLQAAYLYWSGSGKGDFDVALNGNPITAERTFSSSLNAFYTYFAAFKDVTELVQSIGNDTYTLSELDLTDVIAQYCNNSTNFGGWAIILVYEDPSLPLNQLKIFDGFEQVVDAPSTITITLTDLETVDNSETKIGFLAWEGDSALAENESLKLNGTILSNPPLNPGNNAFNGTNTFTNSNQLYNIDIDYYSIEGLINPGDPSATIEITSNQDLILLNNIVTVLNTALPDATITMDNIERPTVCGDRSFTIEYTVYNLEGTDRLPPVSIGFFADNNLVATTQTSNFLEVGEQEGGVISFEVSEVVPADFELRAFVDYQDTVNEVDDTNNEDSSPEHLLIYPDASGLTNLETCGTFGTLVFDLSEATLQINPENTLFYFLSQEDAENNNNALVNPEAFVNTENPQTIWIRVSNEDCYVVDSFVVEALDCPDATVSIDNDIYACRQRDLTIEYTVYNSKGTDVLPAGTPIAFYADGILVGQSVTIAEIAIGGSESGSLEVDLPESIPDQFTLLAVVDDDGTGAGIVEELNEFNNEFSIEVEFGSLPDINPLPPLTECDTGLEIAIFNLFDEELLAAITANSSGTVSFFMQLEDAIANENAIVNPGEFENTSNPQTIYVRLENEICFTTASFQLIVEKCPPIIPDGISPNGDGLNDDFQIDYIVDVFPNFVLRIYSREGNLIYEGGNEEGLWNAIPNRGILLQSKVVPVGTYFYVLVLNDPEYPKPFIGDVYVNY